MAPWEIYIPPAVCLVSLSYKAPWRHLAQSCSSLDCGASRLQPWTDRPPLTHKACVENKQWSNDRADTLCCCNFKKKTHSSVCLVLLFHVHYRKTFYLTHCIHRRTPVPTCDTCGSQDIRQPFQTPWLRPGWLFLSPTVPEVHSHLSLGQEADAFDGTTC